MSAVAYDPSLQATRSRLLADKVIAITGASSGIGAEAARVFAREGAAVVLGARSEDRLVELRDELAAVGAEASDVVSNVTSASDMQCLIDQAIAGTAVWTAPSTTPASAKGAEPWPTSPRRPSTGSSPST